MKTLVFDIETNGITDFTNLTDLKCIHCIGVSDGISTKVYHGKLEVENAVKLLTKADVLVGHNVFGFDIRALKLLFNFQPKGIVYDTLILSRLCWPDVKEEDFTRLNSGFPKNYIGRHSLGAWGYRLGVIKGQFKDTNTFETFSQEMADYCARDVEITSLLYAKLQGQELNPKSVALEQEFSLIMQEQERCGIPFNIEGATSLYSDLIDLKSKLTTELVSLFPPKIVQLKTKQKVIPFNPGSRLQISEGLIAKHGWRPTEFTPDGRPMVNEEILSTLEYDEAKLLSRYLLLEKRIGQLGDGNEGWLKLVKKGRIHGRVNTNGALTGRCTHSSPNMAQVPSVKSPWGKECRALFYAPAGYKMVGVDASGLELRCLAHYMAKYDDGKYAETVVNGDIHTLNQKAAGLPTRDAAKLFIYALIYGAGDEKIGKIIGGTRQSGKQIKDKFLAKVPAIKKLKEGVEYALDIKKSLNGLDGRKLKPRSKHAALNTLLQSAGAVLMKRATILSWEKFKKAGIEVQQVAHVHDEIQFITKEENAERVGKLCVESIAEAGKIFGFRCSLGGEYRVGNNWAETH